MTADYDASKSFPKWMAYEIEGLKFWELFGLASRGEHVIGNGLSWVINDDSYAGETVRCWLDGRSEAEGEQTLDRFLELLRIVLRFKFTTPQLIVADLGDERLHLRAGTWLPEGGISNSQLEELQKRWPHWSRRDPYLDSAVEHFSDAYFSMHPADTIANAIMSMEAVVASIVPEREKGRERDVLFRRLPRLLTTSLRARDSLGELVSRLYRIRNGKAHTDPHSQRAAQLQKLATEKGDIPNDVSLEVFAAASNAILTFHDRLSGGETIDEIYRSLDRTS